MKKYIVFLIAVIVVALAAYGILENLPPSKGKVEGMIYKQAELSANRYKQSYKINTNSV